MSEPIVAIYKGMCPNCGGDISSRELLTSGVCGKCLPTAVGSREEALKELRRRKKIGEYAKVLELQSEAREFSEFFKKLVGSRPWALQEVWARRVLLGRSFSIVAPTGIGKTHFGLVLSLFLAKKGRRSYIIVPTSLLVKHLLDRTGEMFARAGLDPPAVLGYYSGMPKKEAEETLQRIAGGDFSLLITTDRFLYGRFDLIRNARFDFIFVDDVDSFLKSPKNIDKVVALLGFQPEDIEMALSGRGVQKKENPDRVLVVSGATLRGKRTKRIKIFRELLGFEPGFSMELVRNIAGFFLKPERNVEEEVPRILKRHGPGCLIFVPQVKGLEYAEKIAELLRSAGMNVFLYERMVPGMLEKFVGGEYVAILGVASNRSPLARGLDLPETVRYTVFAGVPRREIRVGIKEPNPQKILTLLKAVSPLFGGELGRRAAKVIADLSKIVPVKGEIIEQIREAEERGAPLEGFAAHVHSVVLSARKILEEAMEDPDFRKAVERLDVDVKIEGREYVLVIPDVEGYIQASGRASRFFAAGISRGVSIVIVDDEKSLAGLSRRLRLLADEELEEYSPEKAEREFEQVDRDREKIRKIRLGEFRVETMDILRSAMLVVESPTKARTIARLFGSPAHREVNGFTVYEIASGQRILSIVASAGHLFDLTIQEGFHGVLKENGLYIPVYTDIRRCMSCGEQFTDRQTCPYCGSANVRSKKETVDMLRKLALEVNEVLIGTDPDAEGEKIAFDVFAALRPYCSEMKRLEFHEVTRKALRSALESPREINPAYVQAQVVRRIEDRWVGFELSRKLWEKFGRRNLSAGRVQTPVLGWIVKRAAEVRKKIPVATVRLENGLSVRFQNPPGLDELREKFRRGVLKGSVVNASTGEEKIYPPPPYTTDAMLRDAARRLGLAASRTMDLAQTLFECGLITYHRTDSTTVSSVGIEVARRFLEENHPGLFRPREYRREGAHECIRPTKPMNAHQLRFYLSSGILRLPEKLGADHFRLYDLIFRRFIASQMAEAKVLVQKYTVRIDGLEAEQRRTVKILESGFLAVDPVVRLDEEVEEGEYRVVELGVRMQPSAWPYSQGDLIELMKERGIGRPSTYSKIVDTLFKRNYIFEKKGLVFNTRLGGAVYNYLLRNFGRFASEELTRDLEKKIDAVESGQASYQLVLREMEEEVRSAVAQD